MEYRANTRPLEQRTGTRKPLGSCFERTFQVVGLTHACKGQIRTVFCENCLGFHFYFPPRTFEQAFFSASIISGLIKAVYFLGAKYISIGCLNSLKATHSSCNRKIVWSRYQSVLLSLKSFCVSNSFRT